MDVMGYHTRYMDAIFFQPIHTMPRRTITNDT